MANKGEFLHALQATAGVATRDEAEAITKSVFRTLRHRITPEEAAHVEAQLPDGLKQLWGGYIISKLKHQWRGPAGYDWQEFVEHVANDTRLSPERAEALSRAVFHLIKAQISDGQARHVEEQLPHDIKVVWLEA